MQTQCQFDLSIYTEGKATIKHTRPNHESSICNLSKTPRGLWEAWEAWEELTYDWETWEASGRTFQIWILVGQGGFPPFRPHLCIQPLKCHPLVCKPTKCTKVPPGVCVGTWAHVCMGGGALGGWGDFEPNWVGQSGSVLVYILCMYVQL